jgi:dolichol-phosphate mannosyltransferase
VYAAAEPVAAADLSPAAAPELAVVIPTFNERANVEALLDRLHLALAGIAWEAVFVDDDSPDGTADRLRDLAAADPRVRCLRRIGRRGLSSACIEGMLATSAPVLAVMDADLQHDETILPAMLAALRGGEADVVVGSRYVPGGGVGTWDARRAALSRFATRLGRATTGVTLADPMSGFFMLRRDTFEAVARRLSGVGFKILLDILASAPAPLTVREVPYEFRNRMAGESKLDGAVVLEFGTLLLDKTLGRWVPVKFVVFSAVGALGLAVHLATLFLLHRVGDVGFAMAQTVATLVAMTSNFLINNAVTYRDRRLRGWRLLRGWASFAAACSIGAVANIGVAVWAFGQLAGGSSFDWAWSATAGAAVGAVWNYAVTAVYTWGRKG